MNDSNIGSQFVKISKAAEFFNVSHRTIYRWRDNNQIVWKLTPSGQYVYKISELQTTTSSNTTRSKFIYVRVSSRKQVDDLQRQRHFLQSKFPSHSIISDIGSGLNFKRRGLLQLLQLVMSSSVEEIVVSSKDRLCRFGFELIEWLCHQHDTKIVVLESLENTNTEQQFVNDVLSIIQIYTCKWNGKRRYTTKDKKNQITIDIEPTENSKTVE